MWPMLALYLELGQLKVSKQEVPVSGVDAPRTMQARLRTHADTSLTQ